jgi:hypothetical protein
MEQIMLNQTADAAGYITPFANTAAGAIDWSGRPANATPTRLVTAADLLSVAMGFDAASYTVEIEPAALETEQLAAVAQVAWAQYHEVGKMLARSVRALRNRMSAGQYTQLLETMPGFRI